MKKLVKGDKICITSTDESHVKLGDIYTVVSTKKLKKGLSVTVKELEKPILLVNI